MYFKVITSLYYLYSKFMSLIRYIINKIKQLISNIVRKIKTQGKKKVTGMNISRNYKVLARCVRLGLGT